LAWSVIVDAVERPWSLTVEAPWSLTVEAASVAVDFTGWTSSTVILPVSPISTSNGSLGRAGNH
jgi:hypothetical protein